MKHVNTGKSGEKEKRKRGRKLKSNPQINRYMIRPNERVLILIQAIGKLNNMIKIVTVDKSVFRLCDVIIWFFEQFRAIKTNDN
ncbi:hypothetical protein EZS27_023637 [termite gut metagenome]|uniref:Uncharacterized protein n=1 Tax=termite gut metagenome TaxID=433724 RepID=A0A5J4R0Y1_9ZZZZ